MLRGKKLASLIAWVMGTAWVAEPNGTRPRASGPVTRPKMSVAAMVTGLPGAAGRVAVKLPSLCTGMLATEALVAVLTRSTLIGALPVTDCGWPVMVTVVPARLMLIRPRAICGAIVA